MNNTINVGDLCTIMVYPNGRILVKNMMDVGEFIITAGPDTIKIASSTFEFKTQDFIWEFKKANGPLESWELTKKEPINDYLSQLQSYLERAVSVNIILDKSNVILYPVDTDYPIVKIPHCLYHMEVKNEIYNDRANPYYHILLINNEVEISIRDFIVKEFKFKGEM